MTLFIGKVYTINSKIATGKFFSIFRMGGQHILFEWNRSTFKNITSTCHCHVLATLYCLTVISKDVEELDKDIQLN